MRVFYTPAQSVANNDSFSPSAGKPALLVEQWRTRWPDKLEFVEPQPVTAAALSLAHKSSMVEEILSCQGYNGFGNRSQEVARSLPWTTGSFVSATQYVVEHGGAACSPTSGFHHAGFDFSSAFCTFNGLMVAAMMVRHEVSRIGILDCDYHYGNGTDDIIEALGLENVGHLTTGRLPRALGPEGFLEQLPQFLSEMKAGVLLYQAGADAHIDDPLGGWMTSEQMRRRDRIVFEYCKTNGMPVVWNLAGGYQENIQNVLDLHHATMEECLKVFAG
ncbi:MAG: histone deacetylase [Vulcanimicrobiota bacterium]